MGSYAGLCLGLFFLAALDKDSPHRLSELVYRFLSSLARKWRAWFGIQVECLILYCRHKVAYQPCCAFLNRNGTVRIN